MKSEELRVIEARKPLISYEFIQELWRYRELLYVLAWRDFKVRYKQTMLGILWALIQPTLFTIVMTIALQRISSLNTSTLPYPVFVLAGLIFWNISFNGITAMTESLLKNAMLIQKIYFPRILLPLASVGVFIIDFFIGVILFIGIGIFYHIPFHVMSIVMLCVGLIISLLTSLGCGLFLSALNVKYRDVKYTLPFALQLFFFITPIIYSTTHILWFLHPLTGAIEGFRQSFNPASIEWNGIAVSFGVSILIFISGLIFFNTQESVFPDII